MAAKRKHAQDDVEDLTFDPEESDWYYHYDEDQWWVLHAGLWYFYDADRNMVLDWFWKQPKPNDPDEDKAGKGKGKQGKGKGKAWSSASSSRDKGCPTAKIAEREYLDVRGHDMMDDDTTVLVIELNPAGVNYSAPQGAGCCTLQ